MSGNALQTQSTGDQAGTDGVTTFLVKVGLLPQVGRFSTATPMALSRRQRVVCRTARGLEVGTVMGACSHSDSLADGRILRRLGPEDELLWGHLQSLSQQAHADCVRWLDSHLVDATLLVVEPLLDGKTLYFHFLDAVSAEVESHLDELVESYEASVRQSKFSQLLEHGCGPGCGTEKAVNGCGSRGGCAVCKVASACKK